MCTPKAILKHRPLPKKLKLACQTSRTGESKLGTFSVFRMDLSGVTFISLVHSLFVRIKLL